MNDNKFSVNRTKRVSLLIRLLIPALVIGALVFPTSDRSVVNVRADDCNLNSITLEYCYYNCANLTTYEAKRACYADCEIAHSQRGMTCSYPNHSPMIIGGGGCDPAANGQRAYDNCLAGTLSGSWLEQYFIYMAYYDDEEISCGMIAQGVEAQGCF